MTPARVRAPRSAGRQPRRCPAPGSETDPGAAAGAAFAVTRLTDHARPLLGHLGLGGGFLRLGREAEPPGRSRRQRRVGRLVDRAVTDECLQLDRARLALQPVILAGGRVQVLLPEPGAGRVGGGLADRLAVVGVVLRVGWDYDL